MDQYPPKTATCYDLIKAYPSLRKDAQAWQRRHPQHPAYVAPAVIRIHGLPYYIVGYQSNHKICEFVADKWRVCGFNVRIKDNNIYARRK